MIVILNVPLCTSNHAVPCVCPPPPFPSPLPYTPPLPYTHTGRTLAGKTAAELHPMLIALSRGRMHVEVCLQACCQLLAEKKAVKVKPVVKGLQYIITTAAAGGEVSQGPTQGPTQGPSQAAAGNTGAVLDGVLAQRAAAGAWMILSALLPHEASAADWEFLASQWKATVGTVCLGGHTQVHRNSICRSTSVRHLYVLASNPTHPASIQNGTKTISDSVTTRSAVCLLQAMAAAGEQCPPAQAQQLRQELLDVARTLRIPAPLMAAHIAALAHMSANDHTLWASPLIAAAEKVVAAFVEGVQSGASQRAPGDVDAVCAALFAIGEVVGTSGCAVNSQVVVLVQALLSPGHTLAPTQQWAADTEGPAGGPCEGPVAPRVQAQAWATLGKLCVVNAALAKRCAPVFVQELSRNPLPAVRNNILVVLRDLCVHFTALVDGHVPKLLRATFDAHVLVRTQALALLANLLQKVVWVGVGGLYKCVCVRVCWNAAGWGTQGLVV